MTESGKPQNPGTGRPAQAGGVRYLDQALWQQLRESRDQREFLSTWLALQARMLDGVLEGAVVLEGSGQAPFSLAAAWPGGSGTSDRLKDLLQKILESGKGVVTRGHQEETEDENGPIQVGYPVKVAGKLAGAAGFEVSSRPREQLQPVMRQIQWGLAWVENWLYQAATAGAEPARSRISLALDLTAVTLQEKGYKASANALATELAARLDCERVSLGAMSHQYVRVKALSHAAQFKKQMNIIRAIEAAMAESVDQAEPVVYPEPSWGGGFTMTRAHEALVAQTGDSAVCTVPFMDVTGHGYGALTLERTSSKPFTEEEVEVIDTMASLTGPILEEKRLNDRWFAARALDSARTGLGKVFGPGHLVLKGVVVTLIALIVFLSVASGQYRVTAKSTIEGLVQRAVVAPYDGFLADAHVRAGETVRQGQVLCSLDDRDMRLEKVRWTSQREQFLRQYREAMAEGNRANVKILREQISQAEAQINLLDEQLVRTRMVAPFDGLVITGDLSQALGSPVQVGQVLFEIAPLEDYRLILRVDERDINRIEPGQKGKLVLNALPEDPLLMTVTRITPVSAAEEGHNFFVVEGNLDGNYPNLRPGMEGYGKVTVGPRKLIWIWTHNIYDWFRLWIWSWWP